MARFFLPKMSFILTVLFFCFVATVYALKPESVSQQQTSARMANMPVYRVVADAAELAGEDLSASPAKVLVADRADGRLSDATVESSSDMSPPSSSSISEPAKSVSGPESAAPNSMALVPKADASRGDKPSAKLGTGNATNLEVEELKDLGMANISSGGAWYTLQTAYIPASDPGILSRRLMELSDALGSREGVFVYQTNRSEGVFYGVCVKRFASAAQAKSFKKTLDKKLGYATQLRSQKGLQTEVGF